MGLESHPGVGQHRPAGRQGAPGALSARGPAGAPPGEPVQEAVGEGVVGLPLVADHGGQRGAQQEEVERVPGERGVEVERAEHLAPAHLLHGLEALAAQEAVAQHPGGVDDAAEPDAGVVQPGGERGDLLGVGDVAAPVVHGRAGSRAAAQFPEGVLVGGRTADQDHVRRRAAAQEVGGDAAAEPAQSSGDEVAAAAVEQRTGVAGLGCRFRVQHRGVPSAGGEPHPVRVVPARLGEQFTGGDPAGVHAGEAHGEAAGLARDGADQAVQRVGGGRGVGVVGRPGGHQQHPGAVQRTAADERPQHAEHRAEGVLGERRPRSRRLRQGQRIRAEGRPGAGQVDEDGRGGSVGAGGGGERGLVGGPGGREDHVRARPQARGERAVPDHPQGSARRAGLGAAGEGRPPVQPVTVHGDLRVLRHLVRSVRHRPFHRGRGAGHGAVGGLVDADAEAFREGEDGAAHRVDQAQVEDMDTGAFVEPDPLCVDVDPAGDGFVDGEPVDGQRPQPPAEVPGPSASSSRAAVWHAPSNRAGWSTWRPSGSSPSGSRSSAVTSSPCTTARRTVR